MRWTGSRRWRDWRRWSRYARRCCRRYRSASLFDQPVQNGGQPAKVVDEEIVAVRISNDRSQDSLVDLEKQHN